MGQDVGISNDRLISKPGRVSDVINGDLLPALLLVTMPHALTLLVFNPLLILSFERLS
jgi:hypothetical protein